MTDKILSTLFTKVFATFIMLLVVILNTNTFGAEGTGTIALVILGLALLQVLANFCGGTTLVYLTPQKKLFQLLFLSYAWALFSNTAGLIVLYLLDLVPKEYMIYLIIMTLVDSVYSIHTCVMQGKEDIRTFNIFQLTQATLLLIFMGVALLTCRLTHLTPDIRIYLCAYILSYLLPTIGTCFYIGKRVEHPDFENIGPLFKEMFKLGFWNQLANLTQLLTYRLNYYFIENFIGRESVGIYELGTRISEAVWIFPRSISVVQYARISNSTDDEYDKKLTLGLLKIVFMFALLAVICLLLLPASVLGWIFGPEFVLSKPVICSLLPGILCLSCTSILTHHFSGHGKYWVNAVSSVTGLTVTAVLGLTLIPRATEVGTLHALQTAGWISSCAYGSSLLISLIVFIIMFHPHANEFLISREDRLLFKSIIIEKIKNIKQKKSK